jgi:glycerol transport system ATP-binding protein
MNFLDATVISGKVSIEGVAIAVAQNKIPDGKIQVGIRPEYVGLSDSKNSGVNVQVKSVQDQGNNRVVTCRIGSQELKMKVPRSVVLPDSGEISISLPSDKTLVYHQGNLVKG